MAIVQYSGIITQLRGKLGGSVFNKYRTGFSIQRKQQPRRAPSSYQRSHRNTFSNIQRHWALVETFNQAAFELAAINNPVRDRFGNLIALSGYNYFIKYNLLRNSLALPILDTIDTLTAPPLGLELASITVLADLNPSAPTFLFIDFSLVITIASDRPYGVLLYYSSSVSNGVTNFHGRYFGTIGKIQESFTPVDDTKDFSFTIETPASYAPPVVESEIVFKIVVFDLANGAIVQQFVGRALVEQA